MRTIWNTLKYGNKKVIFYVIFVIAIFIVAAVLFGLAVTNGSAVMGIGAVILILFNIVLLKKLTEEEVEEDELEEKEEGEKEKKETEEKNRSYTENNLEEKEETNYKNYSSKSQIKQYLYTYKVKKENKTVMIDLWSKYRLKQCPAYIWLEKKKLCLLVFDEQPRKLEVPLHTMGTALEYEKGVSANPLKEYVNLKKATLVNAVFAPFIPTYNEEIYNGVSRFRKNRYVLAKEIKFTNTSARTLFELLHLSFEVEDNCTKSYQVNDYVKSAYKRNILLKDEVITIEEYRAEIQKIIKGMIEDNISFDVYIQTIELMAEYHLISGEYESYYKSYWRNYHTGAKINRE